MATATARMTLGSVLGTVGTAAVAVSSIFDTTTKGVGMLENYVDAALEEQRDRIAADSVDRIQRIGEEKATEMALRQLQVLKFCAQTPEHKTLFTTNYDKVMEAINARHVDEKTAA